MSNVDHSAQIAKGAEKQVLEGVCVCDGELWLTWRMVRGVSQNTSIGVNLEPIALFTALLGSAAILVRVRQVDHGL